MVVLSGEGALAGWEFMWWARYGKYEASVRAGATWISAADWSYVRSGCVLIASSRYVSVRCCAASSERYSSSGSINRMASSTPWNGVASSSWNEKNVHWPKPSQAASSVNLAGVKCSSASRNVLCAELGTFQHQAGLGSRVRMFVHHSSGTHASHTQVDSACACARAARAEVHTAVEAQPKPAACACAR
eukprot:229380-Prymnesium_polylepis.2